jgi:hypothetical protein
LSGAARAAELAGDSAKAEYFKRQLRDPAPANTP